MKERTLTETTERVKGRIPGNYDMKHADIAQLGALAKNDLFAAISAAFEFGYAMGHDATAAGYYTEKA